jgi:pimeloyl-ACP methyl ester carboxylesterase
MPVLAAAGWRVAAMDLRGYGGSDKTPRGYDPFTFAADITGVIRSLGERQAVLVGHGWGGYGAWTAAALRPAHVRAVAVASMPHPLALRRALIRGRFRHSGSLLGVQLPITPERKLVADDAAHVEHLLRQWSGPHSTFPDDEAARRYRAAMRLWPAPHCSLEYQRWVVRSLFRSDGRRFAQRLRDPIDLPALLLHGTADRTMSPALATASREFVTGPSRSVELGGIGHFPHEEAPEQVNDALLGWLAGLD